MSEASPSLVPDDGDRVVGIHDILTKFLPVSTVTFWNMRRRGEFPPAIRIAPNRIGWKLSVVREWISTRPAA